MPEPSITDWIQVIISIVTLIISASGLIYVALTLREQNRVNAAQYELLSIESKRAAREVKPRLLIEFKDYKYKLFVNIVYEVKIINNDAYSICFEYLSLPWGHRYSDNLKPGNVIPLLRAGNAEAFTISSVIHFEGIPLIRVHYKDVDGRTYYDDFKLMLRNVYSISDNRTSLYPGTNRISNFIPYGNTMKRLGPMLDSGEYPVLDEEWTNPI
jgi:hypothetical protein